ncbi:MAG: hypothetical protein V5783_00985 [Pontiella sp.]
MKNIVTMSMVALFCAVQTVTAQFFANDLTDASSVALDFDEYIGSQSNSVWTYTNDYALAQDGSTNTVLQGGGGSGLGDNR